MAATFLLVLVVVGVARATVPKPCQGGPTSWCRDMATAVLCHGEQHCRDPGDSLALGDMAKGDVAEGDEAEGDVLAPGRGKKCSLCTKILGKVKAMAGEDPDEAAVAAALSKCCGARAGPWGRLCRRLLRKYRDRIGAALRDGRDPRAVCAAIGLCRA